MSLTINTGLENLNGLSALMSIGGSFEIYECDALTDISGLASLSAVGWQLMVYGNDALEDISGINNLSMLPDDLWIANNIALANISGLTSLTSIGADLEIENNDALTAMSGLSAISNVGAEVRINNNDLLQHLDDLSGITSIGGDLTVFFNNEIRDISGLQNIDATTITNLLIRGNPQLSACAIESVCNYLTIDTNTATIAENGTGCESREAVEMACVVSTDTPVAAKTSVYPNPSTGQVFLKGITAERVEVFSAQGQRVASFVLPGGALDISHLPSGVYVLQMYTTKGNYQARLLKQ